MTARRHGATVVAAARTEFDTARGSIAPPLWASDTFAWDNPSDKPEYDYARTVQPNRDLLADTLSELEGAAGGVITSSGQSAAMLAVLLLPADALILAPHDCYGGTYRLFDALATQGRCRVQFVDMRDSASVEAALAGRPAMLWIETPSNPLLRVSDIRSLARAAKAVGAIVAADNTLATPLRQRPLALGCDLVMHSTTKAINGHSDLIGGALLAADPALVERAQWWANAAGLTGGAYDSWQTMRGLRTLELRLARQEANAREIALWLDQHPGVTCVNYPGLDAHPDHALAARQQDGPGFMISFRVTGGSAAAARFVGALELITLASSLGSHATLICQPWTMTHRGMAEPARIAAGIDPDLLRLSVGIEHVDDLCTDLARGFAALD